MQLSEQQFYILLAALPALIVAVMTYALSAWRHARVRQQYDQRLEELQRDVQAREQAVHGLETDLAVRRQQIESMSDSLREARDQRAGLQHRLEDLQRELHQAQTVMETRRAEQLKERQFMDEKLQQLEHNRERLKKDFEQLAQQVLKTTQQEFSTQSRQGLDDFLRPFRQQVSDFRTKVESIHSDDLKQREALKTELKQLQQLNLQMTQEAHELSTALKGQKKTQGNWGELILENVLDRSGLQRDRDYRREVSFATEEGRRRPDVIVYLPQEKHLIIDAKVSLNAYTRYVNAESEVERTQAIQEHVHSLSQRIRELSDRNYFELPGLKSPEMVFMFVPIESAFVEAIRADETLFQMAIEQHILVTTPTTLLTSLNIVRQLWRFEDQNKHATQLADQAAKVYNQLRLFLESMEALGVQLDRSRKLYDQALNQFISGRGNLVKRVEDFQQLGVSVKKEMPRAILEKARLELDLIEHHEDSSDSDQ
jgi:DNA recombination protein RmuC